MQPGVYQIAAAGFAVYPRENALAYLSLGLANEAGEAAGKVKKYFRGDYSKAELKEKMKGELGDVVWYLAVLSDELGLNLSDIMDSNIEKLRDRRNRGVIKGDGDNR